MENLQLSSDVIWWAQMGLDYALPLIVGLAVAGALARVGNFAAQEVLAFWLANVRPFLRVVLISSGLKAQTVDRLLRAIDAGLRLAVKLYDKTPLPARPATKEGPPLAGRLGELRVREAFPAREDDYE